MNHEIGNPLYKEGDTVAFDITFDNGVKEVIGKVFIVDAYGTFEQSEEPSYDILSEEQNVLFKHIRESGVKRNVE